MIQLSTSITMLTWYILYTTDTLNGSRESLEQFHAIYFATVSTSKWNPALSSRSMKDCPRQAGV